MVWLPIHDVELSRLAEILLKSESFGGLLSPFVSEIQFGAKEVKMDAERKNHELPLQHFGKPSQPSKLYIVAHGTTNLPSKFFVKAPAEFCDTVIDTPEADALGTKRLIEDPETKEQMCGRQWTGSQMAELLQLAGLPLNGDIDIELITCGAGGVWNAEKKSFLPYVGGDNKPLGQVLGEALTSVIGCTRRVTITAYNKSLTQSFQNGQVNAGKIATCVTGETAYQCEELEPFCELNPEELKANISFSNKKGTNPNILNMSFVCPDRGASEEEGFVDDKVVADEVKESKD